MASKFLSASGAAAAILVLAGCASGTKPSIQPRAEAPAPTGGALQGQAMAFESFMRKGQGIDPAFSSGGEVNQALQTGSAHEPRQLEAGMIAYAALAALQQPGFVDGVRRQARTGDLARRLAADPDAVLAVPGAQAAARRAGGALIREGAALSGTGERVKRAAYKVQRQAWSKAAVPRPAARLAEVKRISAAGYRPQAGDAASLRTSLAAGGSRSGDVSSVVTRGVALAALSVLGQEGRGHALMSEPRSASCLRMAKLNLYQCLASARPHYEDIYCLGQHALIDPGQCVADAAEERPRITRASYRR